MFDHGWDDTLKLPKAVEMSVLEVPESSKKWYRVSQSWVPECKWSESKNSWFKSFKRFKHSEALFDALRAPKIKSVFPDVACVPPL